MRLARVRLESNYDLEQITSVLNHSVMHPKVFYYERRRERRVCAFQVTIQENRGSPIRNTRKYQYKSEMFLARSIETK